MKLNFTFHGSSENCDKELEVSSLPPLRERAGRLEILNDGGKREVDWAEATPQTYSILLDGKSYDVRIEKGRADDEEGGAVYTVHVGAGVYRVKLRDPRRTRRSGASGAHEGARNIHAPMPGKVVKVLATVGQAVKAGDSLLVIEAMKMQNEIRAPRDAQVETIRVAEGEGVEAGALLLRLS